MFMKQIIDIDVICLSNTLKSFIIMNETRGFMIFSILLCISRTPYLLEAAIWFFPVAYGFVLPVEDKRWLSVRINRTT